MKTISEKGFVIMLVIILMALIGIALLYLSSASNTMMLQANNAYLKACKRNLITSGLAWAKINSQNFDKIIDLDVADMNILNSSLHVTIKSQKDKLQEVQISASCSSGRLKMASDDTFKIEQ